jgi:antitoxin MazE
MQIANWGNSLAVRLPAELVRGLGLKEGDQIDLAEDDGQVRARRLARADEVLTGLSCFRGKLPAAERLSRDDRLGCGLYQYVERGHVRWPAP